MGALCDPQLDGLGRDHECLAEPRRGQLTRRDQIPHTSDGDAQALACCGRREVAGRRVGTMIKCHAKIILVHTVNVKLEGCDAARQGLPRLANWQDADLGAIVGAVRPRHDRATAPGFLDTCCHRT